MASISDFELFPTAAPRRLNRLKSYAAMGESPPDEFLQECQSDPVLKIHYARMALQKLW